MRVKATVMAPSMPPDAPESPVPVPLGTMGVRCSAASRTMAETWSALSGSATAMGSWLLR